MKILSILMVLFIMLAQECNHHKEGSDGDHSEKTEEQSNDEHSTNEQSEDQTYTGEQRPLIEINKNPCFGNCSIYTLTIHTNGLAIFQGKRFTAKLGKFSKQLSKANILDLEKEFKQIGFMEMNDRYASKLPDSPKTHISYYSSADTKKTVTGDSFRPEPLLALDKKLTEIAESIEGWTLIEKNPGTTELPKYFIRNEIIAQFNQDIDIPDYITSQSTYGLDIVKSLSKSQGIWLLTFDTTKINPNEMLLKIKDNPGIKEAEFNKNLTTRN